MLLHQAVPGFQAWFGVEPRVDEELRQFVAADLLAQAEHSPDAQALLVTTSAALAAEVARTVTLQARNLSRARILAESVRAAGGQAAIVADNYVLALEAASRRQRTGAPIVSLASCHRVLRGQPFDAPGMRSTAWQQGRNWLSSSSQNA